MFIATSKSHGRCNLLDYTRQEIELFRKVTWSCLSCQTPVTLKNGSQIAPHFAHRAEASCQSFSEGESEEHLRGKALLAQWCEQDNLVYELEAYLPELQQRPDLLIDETIALEFQCSRLPLELLVKRTENYLAHGYTVIWIFGSHFFLKKQLSQLQLATLAYSSQVGFYLWQLDGQKAQLTLNYFIEEVIGAQHAHFKQKHWQLGQASLLEILAFPQTNQVKLERHYSSQAIILNYLKRLPRRLQNKQQSTLQLQLIFYRYGTHLAELSNLYFLPVTRSLLVGDEIILWRWQVWQILLKEDAVSLETLWQELKGFSQGQASFQQAQPLIPKDLTLSLLIDEYLICLTELGFIQLSKGVVTVLQKPGRLPHLPLREKSLSHYLASWEHISAIPRQTMILLE